MLNSYQSFLKKMAFHITTKTLHSSLSQTHKPTSPMFKACGGHFSLKKMTLKILQYEFYWSTMFKDVVSILNLEE
jgi:hypothetical protein